MQLSNIPAKLLLAFAAAGGRNTIPVDSQISTIPGAASFTDGFPPLTRTPIVAGGIPPSGLDMNGILYELSALLRWLNAGGGFPFDATFAGDANVGGYPKGARVMRSDGKGYWLNTLDNNGVDPESVSAGQAAVAGWVPDVTNGVAAVTMTNANVILTPDQYGMPIIVITGTLSANLNLIFPAIKGEWVVVNNTTGAYSITCKTESGTGPVVTSSRFIFSDGINIHGSDNGTMGNYIDAISLNVGVTTNILPNQSGAHFQAQGGVVNLPPLSSTRAGSSFRISTSAATILNAAGVDQILIGSFASSTLALTSGDFVTIVNSSGSSWQVVSGASALGRTGAFAALLAGNGYQKLPNGLIVQWASLITTGAGVEATWTYPVTFPNSAFAVFGISNDGSGPYVLASTATPGLSSAKFKSTSPSASSNNFVFAIGD